MNKNAGEVTEMAVKIRELIDAIVAGRAVADDEYFAASQRLYQEATLLCDWLKYRMRQCDELALDLSAALSDKEST